MSAPSVCEEPTLIRDDKGLPAILVRSEASVTFMREGKRSQSSPFLSLGAVAIVGRPFTHLQPPKKKDVEVKIAKVFHLFTRKVH